MGLLPAERKAHVVGALGQRIRDSELFSRTRQNPIQVLSFSTGRRCRFLLAFTGGGKSDVARGRSKTRIPAWEISHIHNHQPDGDDLTKRMDGGGDGRAVWRSERNHSPPRRLAAELMAILGLVVLGVAVLGADAPPGAAQPAAAPRRRATGRGGACP
jgi:hypothetical protein